VSRPRSILAVPRRGTGTETQTGHPVATEEQQSIRPVPSSSTQRYPSDIDLPSLHRAPYGDDGAAHHDPAPGERRAELGHDRQAGQHSPSVTRPGSLQLGSASFSWRTSM